MDSPQNDIYTEKEMIMDHHTLIYERKIDNQMSEQIETLIQRQYNVFVPALVFEYKPTHNIREFSGWDSEDLSEFFSHFGEIELLEIYGKLSIVVFKTFLDAYSCKEFLQNSSNFKDSEKDNFVIRWFTQEDEGFSSEIIRNKMKKYKPNQIMELINSPNSWNNNTNYNNQMNYGNYYNQYNNNQNMSIDPFPVSLNKQYNYYGTMCLSPSAKGEFTSVLNMSNLQQSNSYNNGNYQGYDEDVKSASDKCLLNGKYTCKFEIQIENDNEFQVARRLIGAKVIRNIDLIRVVT
jgi:hypothetical protein